MLERVLGGRRDRGEGVVGYLAVILLVVSLVAAVVTTGVGGRVSSGVGDGVCRVTQDAGCGGVRAGGTAPGETASPQVEEDGRRSGPVGRVAGSGHGGGKGGCGFLGLSCAGRAAGDFFGGAWGGVKDTGGGLKDLVTTNPVTTAKGLGKYLWERSPIPQGVKAYKACSGGDWFGCGGSIACTVATAYCLVKDMVVTPGAEQRFAKGDYWGTAGNVGWNVGSMFIPLKIPGLSKLGKAGELGDDVRVGRANPSTSSQAFNEAVDELGQARQGKKGNAFNYYDLADSFRDLNAAERAKFLERLTPEELLEFYVTARGYRGNIAADILAEAPAETIGKIGPGDLFGVSTGLKEPVRWEPFEGELFKEFGPSYKDVVQAPAAHCMSNCWLAASMAGAPEIAAGMLRENPNGTVTAIFRGGRRITVTRDLPVHPDNKPLGAQVPKEGPIWPALVEKVFAERWGGYPELRGGNPSVALEMMGAKVLDYKRSGQSIPSAGAIARDIRQGDGYVLAITEGHAPKNAASRGIFDNHAYFIIDADPANGTVTIGNPWGPGRSKPFTMTRNELRAPGVFLYKAE